MFNISANLVLKDTSMNPVTVGMLALPALLLVTSHTAQTGNRTTQQLDQKLKSLLFTVKNIVMKQQTKKVMWISS